MVLPLAIGMTTGRTTVGLIASVGALNVALSDRPGPYRRRATWMVFAAATGAVSVAVGAASAGSLLLTVLVTALWGFAGGLLVALGPAATQVGLSSISLLIVFSSLPATPSDAAVWGALVFLWGLVQTGLAAVSWPTRSCARQRSAMAAVYQQLATWPQAPSGPGHAPPFTVEMNEASTALAEMRGNDRASDDLRKLFDRAERIRLELVTLEAVRDELLAHDPTSAMVEELNDIWDGASDVTSEIGSALAARRCSSNMRVALDRVDTAANTLTRLSETNARAAGALPHVQALADLLRDVSTCQPPIVPSGDGVSVGSVGFESFGQHLTEMTAMLRANLTPRSSAFQHAIRLTVALVIAVVLGRALHLPRPYWVPLTVSVVLRPDFATTSTQVVSRVIGTFLGLLLATGLVALASGDASARLALFAGLVFAATTLGPANAGLGAVAISALVVVLLSFVGEPPEALIVARAIDTLVGGVLALVVYSALPTWEGTQTPTHLADLLEAYRQYFAAVMAEYVEPRNSNPARVAHARRAARLARTNAEASLARLQAEPATHPADLDWAEDVLLNSNLFVRSAMVMESVLYHPSDRQVPTPSALQVFVDDVDASLRTLSQALREPAYRPATMPDFQADERTLVRSLSQAGIPASTRTATIRAEAKRVANSLSALQLVVLSPERGSPGDRSVSSPPAAG